MDIKTDVLLPTFVMIILPPNRVMTQIHNCMPAILERGDVKTWNNGSYSGEQRAAWLRQNPCPSANLKITLHKDHRPAT